MDTDTRSESPRRSPRSPRSSANASENATVAASSISLSSSSSSSSSTKRHPPPLPPPPPQATKEDKMAARAARFGGGSAMTKANDKNTDSSSGEKRLREDEVIVPAPLPKRTSPRRSTSGDHSTSSSSQPPPPSKAPNPHLRATTDTNRLTSPASIGGANSNSNSYVSRDFAFKVGTIYKARVTKVAIYGAFITVEGSNRGGLVHTSNISHSRIGDATKYVNTGTAVWAKCIEIKDDGKVSFSMKEINQDTGELIPVIEQPKFVKREKDPVQSSSIPAFISEDSTDPVGDSGTLSRERAMEIVKESFKKNIDSFEYNHAVVQRMKEVYEKQKDYAHNFKKISWAKIHVDGSISYDTDCKNRTKNIVLLIQDAIKYNVQKGKPAPETTLYLFINDLYAVKEQDLPFFVMAKPKNKTGILIPDDTFMSHNNEKHVLETWEETSSICLNSAITQAVDKQSTMFFIGNDTDFNDQKLRGNFARLGNGETVYGVTTAATSATSVTTTSTSSSAGGGDDSKSTKSLSRTKSGGGSSSPRQAAPELTSSAANARIDLPLHISVSKLDENPVRMHISEFSKFKYLLNLPGMQPWSYRFKYLFLVHSLVINIDVRQRYTKPHWTEAKPCETNDTWQCFFDCIFEPSLDYINFAYTWIQDDEVTNAYEFRKLVQSLKVTYDHFEANPGRWSNMVKRGQQKVALLTQEFVYECIYDMIVYYASKINPYL